MTINKLTLQQLAEYTKKTNHYYHYVLPEIVFIFFLQDGTPFYSLLSNNQECKFTKFHKLLHVNLEKKCLILQPVDDNNPIKSNKNKVTIEFSCVCAIQLFKIEKHEIELVDDDEDDEVVGDLIKDDQEKKKKRRLHIPYFPTFTANVAEQENLPTDDEDSSDNHDIDLPEEYEDQHDHNEEEKTEILVEHIIEDEDILYDDVDDEEEDDIYDIEDEDDKKLNGPINKDLGDSPHTKEHQPKKKKKKKKKKKRKSKKNCEHWIVPFSSIINIELDD